MTIDDICKQRPIIIGDDKTKHQCYLCIYSDYGCNEKGYQDIRQDKQLELALNYEVKQNGIPK